MSKKCADCGCEVNPNVIQGMYYCPRCDDDKTERDVLPLTVFDYITQSEEKLVELLVCQIDTTKKKLIVLPEIEEQLYVETTWKSTLTGAFYATKNEAVEATLEELKKEFNNG